MPTSPQSEPGKESEGAAPLPRPVPAPGTVDLTALVETMKGSFIRWGTLFVVSAAKAVPWLSWLAWPIVSSLFSFLVEKIVTVIADAVEMEAFFLNTAFRKAAQAEDYVAAVLAKSALSESASDEEYRNAEKQEMAAFRNFILVTN